MSDSSAWARRSHLLGHAVALAAITILLSTAVATPAALAAPPGAGSAPCPPSHLAGALQARPADCRTPETEPLLIPEPGDPVAPARVRPATLPSARAAGAGPRPPDARRPAAPGAASTGVPR